MLKELSHLFLLANNESRTPRIGCRPWDSHLRGCDLHWIYYTLFWSPSSSFTDPSALLTLQLRSTPLRSHLSTQFYVDIFSLWRTLSHCIHTKQILYRWIPTIDRTADLSLLYNCSNEFSKYYKRRGTERLHHSWKPNCSNTLFIQRWVHV